MADAVAEREPTREIIDREPTREIIDREPTREIIDRDPTREIIDREPTREIIDRERPVGRSSRRPVVSVERHVRVESSGPPGYEPESDAAPVAGRGLSTPLDHVEFCLRDPGTVVGNLDGDTVRDPVGTDSNGRPVGVYPVTDAVFDRVLDQVGHHDHEQGFVSPH